MRRSPGTGTVGRLRTLGLLLAVIGASIVLQPRLASADGYVPVSELLSVGSVRASGLVAEVPVRVTCLRPRDLELDVELRQALPGERIAVATGRAFARCRTGTQTVVASLVSQLGPALVDGPAAVHLDTMCTSYAYVHACRLISERVVQLRADRALDALTATAVSEPALGISVQGTGQLLGHGSVLQLEAALSCPAGADLSAYASVDQRAGSARVHAEGYPSDVVCDGNYHPIVVHLDAAQGAFVAGAAFLQFDMSDDARTPWAGVTPSVSAYGQVALS